ncbi:peptidoglycan-binding protein [Chlorogloeopsis fritschii]|uniref:peptidoglycan-binding domain-containing protein n=1 Tax=Chlorogloeopsis fritschii TaxID=1124 RepID=UPI00370D5202
MAAVQRALGVRATGYYGPVTANAVRNYQARNGLLVDGIVGPQTRRALGIY